MKRTASYQIESFEWLVNRIFHGILHSNAKRVWVLGAGASVDSGIAGATELAHRWSCQIVGQPYPAEKRSDAEDLEEKETNLKLWSKDRQLRIFEQEIEKLLIEPDEVVRLRKINDFLGARYFDIYDALFSAQRQVGFEQLRREMDDKLPSYGYFALAHLMSSQSNLVITVNFDSLVAHALFLTGKKLPLILDHENVAHLAKATTDVPLICKIHRDILKDPLNAKKELGQLAPLWTDVVRRIFRDYSPIFIGYGGNDRTLMEALSGIDSFPDAPIWLHYTTSTDESKIRSEVSEPIARFLNNHDNSVLVTYTGFDSLMRYAETVLDLPSAAESFRNRTEQIYKILNASDARAASQLGESAKTDPIAKASLEAIEKKAIKSVNEWIGLAEAEPDLYKRLRLYDQALQEQDDAVLFNNRGSTKTELGKIKHAVRDFDLAIRAEPDYGDAYYNRGVAMIHLKRYEKAIEDCSKALTLNPTSFRAYFNRGLAKQRIGRLEESALDFDLAIALEPTFSHSYFCKACSLAQLHEVEGAVACLGQAINLERELIAQISREEFDSIRSLDKFESFIKGLRTN